MQNRARACGATATAVFPYLILFFLTACATAPPPAGAPPVPAAAPESEAVLLAVNDVYRIEGVENGAVGGLARLRGLRAELEREHPDLLLLHGGDLLFPSLLSRLYQGQQMIDVLNRLDGDAAGFDRRFFVVFGNHEFERDKLADAALLDGRVEESQFTWVSSNVAFAADAAGVPLVAAPNLVPTAVVESGGLRIGLFGITTDVKAAAYITSFGDPVATAREQSAALREAGAEVVVALTHLDWQQDEEILRQLGAAGPDLIVGGHDHERMAREVGGRWVVKADADARTATVVRLRRAADGTVQVVHDFRRLTGETPPEDPQTAAVVSAWLRRHEEEFCGGQKPPEPADCLSQVLGRTRTPLVAEETAIRREETSLGDWVTDQMVAALAGCGAAAAFVNSGTLRLNQDLPANSEITRRHLEELFGFPAPLRLLRLDGGTLQKVVDHAVEGWPGKGWWLQVSGLAFVHDAERTAAEHLTQLASAGARPVAPGDQLLVATTDFLVDPQGGQDGYTMLDPEQVVECAASGQDLKAVVRQALAAAGPEGIAPQTEGRICSAPAGADCKAVR
jgi:2',3'-cyclic-nucleotide 2'-phosphodiesterase (5'-nucleotidase family)